MALEINDDAFLIRSGGVWILSGELGVTQLAVPLRAMSNFISCTNMKIPHGCNYEVYTTVREEEKEDGEREGGWWDGGGKWGRGGLHLPAGRRPKEDLAETVGYLRLDEGRKVWMLFKRRQNEMSAANLHPNLETANCGQKPKA